jgi:hypothetical protein
MRWKNKPKIKYGDTRIRKLFAFLPVTDGKLTVWLEYITVKETYNAKGTHDDNMNIIHFGQWEVTEIISLNNY